MSRNATKAQRLAELRELLERRPRTAREIAAHFGVSKRTALRDLDDVPALGVTLEKTGDAYFIASRSSALNDLEALAVHTAARLLSHTGVGERHYRAALEKLARQLPERARQPLLRAVDALEPSPEDRALDQVAQAWFQGRVLRCEYRSGRSGRAYRNELLPYWIEVNRRNLEMYVVAYERYYHREVRVFKLKRIERPMLLDDAYDIPEEFDPHRYLSGSWGIVVGEAQEIRLRFDPSVAQAVRELREPNLVIDEETPDGALLVTARVRLSADGSPTEFIPWLLSWGETVEVLAPEAVRARVAERLQAAVGRYA